MTVLGFIFSSSFSCLFPPLPLSSLSPSLLSLSLSPSLLSLSLSLCHLSLLSSLSVSLSLSPSLCHLSLLSSLSLSLSPSLPPSGISLALSLSSQSEPLECSEPILVVSHKLGVCRVDPAGKTCSTSFTRLSYNGHTSIVKCESYIITIIIIPYECVVCNKC